jgi:hypothetical protein
MFVYLNYFKTQNYHKYTHLLQIYVDFSCTDDIDTPPNPEISFQTLLDAVNRQSQEIEAKVGQISA